MNNGSVFLFLNKSLMESLVANFKVPSAEERKRALGSMGGTNFKVKKSLENFDKYWIPKTPPQPGEWLAE
jgi:hypothetical protein